MVGPSGWSVPGADLHQYLTALCERLVVQGDDDHGGISVFRADRDIAQLDGTNRFQEASRALCLRGVERAEPPAVIPHELAGIATNHFPFSVDEAARVSDLRLGRVRPIDNFDRPNEEGKRIDGGGEFWLFSPIGEIATGVIRRILGDDRRSSLPEFLVAAMFNYDRLAERHIAATVHKRCRRKLAEEAWR